MKCLKSLSDGENFNRGGVGSAFHGVANVTPGADFNGGGGGGGGSGADFQRCLGAGTPNFFSSLGGVAMSHVQKGRPRKRKIPALHSNANHSDANSQLSASGLRQLNGMGQSSPLIMQITFIIITSSTIIIIIFNIITLLYIIQ